MKDLDGMISALNKDLAENGFLLNPRKLHAIIISNSAMGVVLPSLFLEIPWCDAVTDLGLGIDGYLRFDRQVSSRVYATLHLLIALH
jgi:hypothetical protein